MIMRQLRLISSITIDGDKYISCEFNDLNKKSLYRLYIIDLKADSDCIIIENQEKNFDFTNNELVEMNFEMNFEDTSKIKIKSSYGFLRSGTVKLFQFENKE